MDQPQKPIPTPYPQRVEDFRRRYLPLVVWSIAALICAVLLFNRGSQGEHLGIAEAFEYELSSATPGTVQQLAVQVFEPVEAGQVVARLDDRAVRASIETSRARIGQITAQIDAARVTARVDTASQTAELRRFQIDEEQRRLDALELRVVIESDEVEAERLSLEERRARRLLEAGLIGQMEYDTIRLELAQVQERLIKNEMLLRSTEDEYRAARGRREEYERGLPERTGESIALQPLREAITVETRVIEEIEVAREATVLRSPVAGQVSQILCRQGQAVVAGEPILTIAERTPREIVAYLREGNDENISSGAKVVVASQARPANSAESLVIRESSTVQQLPLRLWRDPRVPDYGRAVVIAGVPGLQLAPGELVSVRFLK